MRGPVAPVNLGYISISTEKHPQLRISDTVPIVNEVGVIKTTWGQTR
jgi:hypothetical protein